MSGIMPYTQKYSNWRCPSCSASMKCVVIQIVALWKIKCMRLTTWIKLEKGFIIPRKIIWHVCVEIEETCK